MESAAAMFAGNARVLGAAPVLEVVAGARRMRHGDVRARKAYTWHGGWVPRRRAAAIRQLGKVGDTRPPRQHRQRPAAPDGSARPHL
jgi:hypothetical protein